MKRDWHHHEEYRHLERDAEGLAEQEVCYGDPHCTCPDCVEEHFNGLLDADVPYHSAEDPGEVEARLRGEDEEPW